MTAPAVCARISYLGRNTASAAIAAAEAKSTAVNFKVDALTDQTNIMTSIFFVKSYSETAVYIPRKLNVMY